MTITKTLSKLTAVLFSSTVNENLVIRTLRMGRIKKVFVYFLIFLNWAPLLLIKPANGQYLH